MSCQQHEKITYNGGLAIFELGAFCQLHNKKRTRMQDKDRNCFTHASLFMFDD